MLPVHGRLYFTRPHIPETEIKQNCQRSAETITPTVGSFVLFQFYFTACDAVFTHTVPGVIPWNYCLFFQQPFIILRLPRMKSDVGGLHHKQSGTRCQMNLQILTVTVLMALNDSWKQLFSAVVTSETIAIEVLYQAALYKSTLYLLTYLFTRGDLGLLTSRSKVGHGDTRRVFQSYLMVWFFMLLRPFALMVLMAVLCGTSLVPLWSHSFSMPALHGGDILKPMKETDYSQSYPRL